LFAVPHHYRYAIVDRGFALGQGSLFFLEDTFSLGAPFSLCRTAKVSEVESLRLCFEDFKPILLHLNLEPFCSFPCARIPFFFFCIFLLFWVRRRRRLFLISSLNQEGPGTLPQFSFPSFSSLVLCCLGRYRWLGFDCLFLTWCCQTRRPLLEIIRFISYRFF